MNSSDSARVLVVTDRVEATPELLDSIRGRAARGTAEFHVLVPNPAPAEWHPAHPERHEKVEEAGRVLARALPLIEEAAGSAVDGVVSIRHDPMDAIEETLHDADFDEIILFVAPHRIEAWLHVDLPHRVAHLGLPVTTVSSDHRPVEPRA
ncbi:MAG: hypothetical protein QOH72_1016 [Solirubrobacteraceae bacterium]|jgi:hypothetical protein|nr:hypothetical protein [Solirubrobacteraceae bacterium]